MCEEKDMFCKNEGKTTKQEPCVVEVRGEEHLTFKCKSCGGTSVLNYEDGE